MNEYHADIERIQDGLYEASWPAFPGSVVQIEATDEQKALRRAALALLGLITSDRR